MTTTALYVALSGQMALERRLETIANNVANFGTAGYRAEAVHFETAVSRVSPIATGFASHGGAHAVARPGGLARTGNPLDVAIQGEGFMAIQTPAGIAYTRDGRMQILEAGDLVTLAGHPVLDAGGAPILLDPAGGPIEINRDGMIRQGERQAGAIGLFAVDLAQPYRRYENSGFLPARPGTPILTFAADGFAQGFVEQSNVNPVLEMTNLVRVTRAFESLNAAIESSGSALVEAIRTLGART